MAEFQAKLTALSDDFTKLQQELQEAISSRQTLEAQKQENLGVQKEFEKLKGDETVYKLIGPVLLKQDRADAGNTVSRRLEFIAKEISRLEDSIKETQGKMESRKRDILQVQSAAQAAAVTTCSEDQPVKA